MAKFDYSVKQIAREALPRLIDNLVFPNLIYKENISGGAAKQGDTVSVRCPVKLVASEFDESTGVIAQSMQNDTIDVKLDHLATVDMQVGAIESACDFDSVVRMFIEPAAAALAEKINAEGLELAVDKVEKMLVVAGIHLDEYVVFTGGEMTFYNLGNFLYFLHDFIETRRVVKEKADVGACVVTDCFMVDDCFKSLNYAGSEQLLDALVYCCTGYITLACNLQKRLSGIAR